MQHEDRHDSIDGMRGAGRVARCSSPRRGIFTPSSRADAAPRPVRQVGAEITSTDPVASRPSCCSEGPAEERVAGPRRMPTETAAQAEATRFREEAEHHHDHGRRCRLVQHRCLSPGHHGEPDPEPRPARRRGDAVHRLLRRGELYGRTCQFHYRAATDPDRD